MKKLFLLLGLCPGLATVYAQDITRIEYFIDTDPGFGAATEVPGYSPGSPLAFQVPGATLGGLTEGLHRLLIRAKDATGAWSVVHGSLFYKDNFLSSSPAAIVRIEYFVDTDPGFGAATEVPGYSPGSPLAFQVPGATLDVLADGLHRLFIRAKDATGAWSVVHGSLFYKDNFLSSSPAAIVRIEYFVDTDPGFGAATEVPGYSPGSPLAFQVPGATLGGLTEGLHRLFIRAKDVTGAWSVVHSSLFYKDYLLANTLPDIVKVEYFVDTDPGFGAGTEVPFTLNGNVYDVVFNADIDGLDVGPHKLFVRALDARGSWSIVSIEDFDASPLPVHLVDFTAKKQETGVQLSWKTTEEINASHFDIERSADAKTWEGIGKVKAKGESRMLETYTFMDQLPGNSIPSSNQIYYRLKQLDVDGRYTYSAVRGVKWEGSRIRFGPNPVVDQMTVSGLSGGEAFHLYDTAGRLVATGRTTGNSVSIDIGSLSPGVYILSVTNGDTKVLTERITKTGL